MTDLSREDIEFIKELREKHEQGSINRRQALGALGAAGVGVAGGFLGSGTAAADPSTSDSDGNVGTPSDPVDVFADGIQSNTHQKIRYASNFSSLQAAVDDLQSASGSSHAQGKIIADDQGNYYSGTVDINEQGFIFEGYGHNSRIRGSGDHTVDISNSDVTLQHLWIDQVDSDSATYNAINIQSGGMEAMLHDLDIDKSSEWGIYIDDIQVQGSEIYFISTDFDKGAIRLTANAKQCHFSNVNIDGTDQTGMPNGMSIAGAENTFESVGIRETGSNALFIGGDDNEFSGSIVNAGNHAIQINGGSANVISANVKNPTGDAIRIRLSSSGNVLMGHFDGDVTLKSNTSNNLVIGRVTGSITDNGTGNDTSLTV